MLEVCCTTQSRKGMIKLHVVWDFVLVIHLGRLFDRTERPSGNMDGLKLTHLQDDIDDIYSSRRMRGIIMQVNPSYWDIPFFIRTPPMEGIFCAVKYGPVGICNFCLDKGGRNSYFTYN